MRTVRKIHEVGKTFLQNATPAGVAVLDADVVHGVAAGLAAAAARQRARQG